ncbi:MAG: hypothetical protein HY909_09310 [Deltaproteobacteria bacterium]|nr:hypothetical protein [Deltaproteobacteria bacterium]
MGFGPGLDERARHGPAYRATPAAVTLVRRSTEGGPLPRARLLVPAGLRPFVRTPPADWWRFLVTSDPPGRGGPVTQRTVLSDARDLFLRTVLEATGAELPVTEDSAMAGLTDPCVVHLGRTEFLRGLLARRPELFSPSSLWTGDWADVDGDGFVAFSVLVEGTTHLVLAGGSDYGTYFAVAWYLERITGVRWLYPGPRGQVLQRAEVLEDREGVNRLEEPDYRSRTLHTIASSQSFTEAELDAHRTWALNNRLRPGEERRTLLDRALRFGGTANCMAPLQGTQAALLLSEERIPQSHNFARHLPPVWVKVRPSPEALFRGFPPGTLPGDEDTPPSERYVVRNPSSYPDLRPRSSNTAPFPREVAPFPDAEVASVGRWPSLDSRFGWQVSRDLLRVVPLPVGCTPGACRPPLSCPGEVVYPKPSNPTAPTAMNLRLSVGAMLPATMRAHLTASAFQAALAARFTTATKIAGRMRFVPRTFVSTVDLRTVPVGGWFACVYEDREAPPGRLAPVREELTTVLGTQVLLGLQGANLRDPGATHSEGAYSLSPDDHIGNLWCRCDACTVSDSVTNDGAFRVYQGLILGSNQYLSRDGLYAATSLESWQRGLAGDALTPAERDPSDLCLRGVIENGLYRTEQSRRIVDLMNSVAQTVGMPPAHNVLAFQTYESYRGAPVFMPLHGGRLAPDEPTRLSPLLMPFLTGIHDATEYLEPYPPPPAPLSAGPLLVGGAWRMVRAPRQFNLERWSMVTSRLGLYEYVSDAAMVVPRLYTTALYNGLQRAYNRGARAFVAEASAGWGLAGPRLWELARMLWDTTQEPTSLRQELALAMLPTEARASPARVTAAVDLWTDLEADWMRVPRDERPTRGAIFDGQGWGDGFGDGTVTQCDSLSNIDARVRSFTTAFGRASAVVGRPEELYRRVLDFNWLLEQLYRPIRRAYLDVARLAPPLTSSDFPRRPEGALSSPAAMAAAVLRRDDPALGRYFSLPQFELEVRYPVHRAIADSTFTYPETGIERLGLGLFPARRRTEGRWVFGAAVAEILALPRLALWLPSVLEYCAAWDASGGHLIPATYGGGNKEVTIGLFFAGLRWMAAYITEISGYTDAATTMRRGWSVRG